MRSPGTTRQERWWRFTSRDLFAVTLIAAIGVWTIRFLARNFDVPLWVSLSSACMIPGTVIGMLTGQFKGAVIGMIAGGVLALILMAGYVLAAILI